MLATTRSTGLLQVHSKDAVTLNIQDGDWVQMSSSTGTVEAQVAVTDEVMPGCISLPHGYSEQTDLDQSVRRTGPNYNRLAAAAQVDRPSGTSALNGIEVKLEKIETPA